MPNQSEYTVEIIIYCIVPVTIAGMLMELLVRVRRKRMARERAERIEKAKRQIDARKRDNYLKGLWE